MAHKYKDLITQTFDFPQEGFKVLENKLHFDDIDLMDIVERHGSPLKISYLPKIKKQIEKANTLFRNAYQQYSYKGDYTHCYCTKSSHFSFILKEALKSGSNIETSSAYDIAIVQKLYKDGVVSKDTYIICNGFKRPLYLEKIAELINADFKNTIVVLDNKRELEALDKLITKKAKIGLRIACEEQPNFDFYTSRLGIRYKEICDYYEQEIKDNEKFNLVMLHFFINSGIQDSAYYWNELNKCLAVYCDLKKKCDSLHSLNIGGGLPFKSSLGFEFNYQEMIDQMVSRIKSTCNENGLVEPDLFSEFGSFTVAESGINIFSVLDVKQQNDREAWYMIDNSFITSLPDTWAINQRFILLAINNWNADYTRANLGGLTCDSLDYYNSESHTNQVFLPELPPDQPLYIGFFHTGAYQESLGGYGGVKHCLVPAAKHLVLNRDEEGNLTETVFAEEQSEETMLSSLGY